MKIEFLYFDGCASYEKALSRLEKILAEEGVDFPVVMINVDSDNMAEELRFPGSPTIRINGKDIDCADSGSEDGFAKKCRVYVESGVLIGIPSEWSLRKAVRKAKKKSEDI